MGFSMAEEIIREIRDAEMVLVGIGEAFDEGKEQLEEILGAQEEMAWTSPFLYDLQLSNQEHEERRKALAHLADALQGKNYYVISKSQSIDVEETNWREGRLVMVCGRTSVKQCAKACEDSVPEKLTEEEKNRLTHAGMEFIKDAKLFDKGESGTIDNPHDNGALPPEVMQAMKMIAKRNALRESLGKLMEASSILGECPKCGGRVELNVFSAGKYDERGYLKDWDKYTKWLGGSLNRKLLLLEIGCGDAYPNVITKPFEKISELNLKSKILKVNENIIDCLGNL